MTRKVLKLYQFHFFNSIALSVVANTLFIDRLLLQMGLDMKQFGFVKGVSAFLPLIIVLFFSPFMTRLNRDREIVAYSYLLRVLLPYSLLFIPAMIQDKMILTIACSVVMIVLMIFPTLANNSLLALCKQVIPDNMLGRRLSVINILWGLPGTLLAIPFGWYVDRTAGTDGGSFYRAYLYMFMATMVFQIIASGIILKLPRAERARQENNNYSGAIQRPFLNARFRSFMILFLAMSLVFSMTFSFLFPYLLQAEGLSMSTITVITAVFSIFGVFFQRLWGNLADQLGGKNILGLSLWGCAAGVFFLAGGGMWCVLIYAALCWAMGGLFGTGAGIARQILMLKLIDEKESNVYIAASQCMGALGTFSGAVLGGYLLDWLRARINPAMPYEYYKIYFTYCAFGIIIVGSIIAGMFDDGVKKVPLSRLALELYRNIVGIR